VCRPTDCISTESQEPRSWASSSCSRYSRAGLVMDVVGPRLAQPYVGRVGPSRVGVSGDANSRALILLQRRCQLVDLGRVGSSDVAADDIEVDALEYEAARSRLGTREIAAEARRARQSFGFISVLCCATTAPAAGAAVFAASPGARDIVLIRRTRSARGTTPARPPAVRARQAVGASPAACAAQYGCDWACL
jgi:hypothetical protein